MRYRSLVFLVEGMRKDYQTITLACYAMNSQMERVDINVEKEYLSYSFLFKPLTGGAREDKVIAGRIALKTVYDGLYEAGIDMSDEAKVKNGIAEIIEANFIKNATKSTIS